jgi:hypothetical protein
MRKTDKKTDNALRDVLTEVCDIAQENYDGFKWITHFANYNNFPGSLSIVCIYGTNEQLEKADVNGLRDLIQQKLLSIGINNKELRRPVSFDTEENCNTENNGKWDERWLRSRHT